MHLAFLHSYTQVKYWWSWSSYNLDFGPPTSLLACSRSTLRRIFPD